MDVANPIEVETFRFTVTPLSHIGKDKSTPINVDQFDLTVIDLTNSDDENQNQNDDVMILNSKPPDVSFGKRQRSLEKGESCNSNFNNAAFFTCEICTENKPSNDAFRISGCSHSYCKGCVVMYAASKLQENAITITCPVPGCVGSLEPYTCREILPEEVFDRWGNALCEAVILAEEKFYCPFKDCSALMINDGREVVKECECPNCRRLFCAQCKVGWHAGIDCDEFQKLNKDEREKEDIMLMQLSNSKNWRRCPSCRFYIEKSEGCLYMKCRCGYAFCYNCGALSRNNTHYCYNCRR